MKGQWTDHHRERVRATGVRVGWGMILGGLGLSTLVLWRSEAPPVTVLVFLGVLVALGGAAALPDTVAPLISQAIAKWGDDTPEGPAS